MSVLFLLCCALSLVAQITLQLQSPSPSDLNFRVGGMAGFSVTAPPGDVVWVEDSVPSSAITAVENDSWFWTNSGPSSFSGLSSHRSNDYPAMHQHYFFGGQTPLTINPNDLLVAYVYLNPASKPSEIMLQWNDGTWDHRAYWGANLIDFGTDATVSRRHIDALPPAGQWVRLEVPASSVGLEGKTINGMAFTLYGGQATWDHAGKASAPAPPGETVWVDDGLPAGSQSAVENNDEWNWVTVSPSPFSGLKAHRSKWIGGMHQHYFYGATDTLKVNAGDALFTYVYLDSAHMPSEIMLQWNDGSWEHRAYWGTDSLTLWGANGRYSRYFMGPLPPADQWVRLEVPASAVGLEGRTVNGMAFTLFDGRITWDRSGKTAAYSTDQYRLYATTSLPRGMWTADGQSIKDFFQLSLSNDYTGEDRCSGQRDPRYWNPRCVDTIALLTKNITCSSNSPLSACQNTGYWNAYPGRSNMSLFPTRPPVNDDGFGWPSNTNWGVKGLSPVITKDTVNSVQLTPPPTGAPSPTPGPDNVTPPPCHANNPGEFATGVANSKATQVKYLDGTSRWFMAYNSQVHKEWGGSPAGYNGEDLWRVQWAYSNDGKTWTAENRPLLTDITEKNGWCSTGELVTDMFVDTDSSTNTQYFYIVITQTTSDRVWLLRSPVAQYSTAGYDPSRGWEVRGIDPSTRAIRWIQIQLGTQIDFQALGAQSILPTHFSIYGGLVKQTTIGRVFTSSQAFSPSMYVALTVDRDGSNNTNPAVVELWTTDSLNKPFVFQSYVNVPAGGYGYEFGFTHYADNNLSSPRLFDNTFELWFVTDTQCEGLPNCSPLPPAQRPPGTTGPPQYRNQSAFTVARRRATLSGGIYGQ
jgi:hypothetical protein